MNLRKILAIMVMVSLCATSGAALFVPSPAHAGWFSSAAESVVSGFVTMQKNNDKIDKALTYEIVQIKLNQAKKEGDLMYAKDIEGILTPYELVVKEKTIELENAKEKASNDPAKIQQATDAFTKSLAEVSDTLKTQLLAVAKKDYKAAFNKVISDLTLGLVTIDQMDTTNLDKAIDTYGAVIDEAIAAYQKQVSDRTITSRAALQQLIDQKAPQDKLTAVMAAYDNSLAEAHSGFVNDLLKQSATAVDKNVQAENPLAPPEPPQGYKPIQPRLSIPIPDLHFSDADNVEVGTDESGNKVYAIPYIGQYISGIFSYGLGALAIVAVLAIIIAGAIWSMAGGNTSQIDLAKDIIFRSLIGLLIAMGSYTILYIIDPSLTEFKALNISAINRTTYEQNHFEKYGAEPASAADKKEDDADAKTLKPGVTSPGTKVLAGTHPGEYVVGRCHIINEKNFPKFNVNSFGDGRNGKCLLQEFAPTIGDNLAAFPNTYITKTTFLGKPVSVHKKAAAALALVEKDLKTLTSGIAKRWIQDFTTAGAYVMYKDPIEKLTNGACAKAGDETWIVTSATGKTKARLYTRILKNLHGNHGDPLFGDMHSLGLGMDIYAPQNPDSKPIFTNIPSEVVDVFRKHGWSWLGATGRRDAMHFQYFGNTCFKDLGIPYPTGGGCCTAPWGTPSSKTAKYAGCLSGGGKASTYTECLGPKGIPGSMWVAEKE